MKTTLKDPLLLDASVDALSGIGNRRSAAFHELNIRTVWDLLNFLPRTYLNRRHIVPIRELQEGAFASVVGRIGRSQLIPRKRFSIELEDDSGSLLLVWFGRVDYMKGKFPEGERLNVWGKVGFFRDSPQLVHPEYRLLSGDDIPEKGIFPIYTRPEELKEAAIDSKIVRAAVRDALERTREHYPEALPSWVLKKRAWPALKTVYRELHFPSGEDLSALPSYYNRLKYEEAFHLCLKMERLQRAHEEAGIVFHAGERLKKQVLLNTGFNLTTAQARVQKEIEGDLCSAKRMNRLLQGDVGSGKTVICALAAALVVENGYQAAFMAPTEILARQHYREWCRLFAGSDVRIELFTGSQRAADRAVLEEALAEGRIQLAVGTHALFSESTRFRRLGLLMVDEQHRFGVAQRLALKQKGERPDMLVVSATPIPRTLALTLFGDLRLSVIDELPPGRIPVKSFRVTEPKRREMNEFIRKRIISGGRVFFILPLVEESEKQQEVLSVKGMADRLKQEVYPEFGVGLLHGGLPSEEKEAAMEAFRNGTTPVLCATTVVEVGVDVPEADIMVIEHPERFGLAQLHQLRGRIGRGKRESFCFLLIGPTCPEEAYERLGRFTETSDGFRIAEMDFEWRGPGELSGMRQAGFPEFRFLNLLKDRALLEMAREDAQEHEDDPERTPAEEAKRMDEALARFSHLSERVLMTG
ncbi:MAG: hypothetical protein A2293_11955 [Elusimicrobia bacterium RIFOXYB2_FULL_49_7]|nr:MAG: hypothetical protein A2293_11955 [Elusimicrobia bacterium RIFOXYB2_FULL_49_7]